MSFTRTPTQSAAVAALATCLFASLFVAVPAEAAPREPIGSAAALQDAFGQQARDVEQGLGLIQEIPDAVLIEGDAALQHWVVANHPELIKEARADVIGCAAAIAFLIASTAIPAAKILKIKKLIDALGGAAKAVRIFWGASFKWEKIKALGGSAAALGAELLGISSVQQKCFA